MKLKKLVIILCAAFLLLSWQLKAEVQFSIVDTLGLGSYDFAGVIALDETHFIAYGYYSISMYEIAGDQCIRTQQLFYHKPHAMVRKLGLYGDRVYVPTQCGSVLVYQISNHALAFQEELALQAMVGFIDLSYFQIIGNLMLVSNVASPDGQGYQYTYYLDVYDISTPGSCALLARHQIPGTNGIVAQILPYGGGYCILLARGDLYFSPDLLQINYTTILPTLPEGEMISAAFVHNEKLHFATANSFGSNIIRCSSTDTVLLSIDWMMYVPMLVIWDCIVEDNRVSLHGMASSSYIQILRCYTPSEGEWGFEFQRDIFVPGVFHAVSGGYIHIGSTEVRRFDHNFIPGQLLWEGEGHLFETVLLNRYVLFSDSQLYSQKKLYDIEARGWLDFSNTLSLKQNSFRYAENQLIFSNGTSCELLRLDPDGSYTVQSFSIPQSYLNLSTWGNTILSVVTENSNFAIKAYQLNNGVVTNYASCSIGQSSVIDMMFYSPHHFAALMYEYPNGNSMRFYRINPTGDMQILGEFPLPPSNGLFSADHMIMSISPNSPVFNVSNPDIPISSGVLPSTCIDNRFASYDGEQRFLNADFSRINTFRAEKPFYIGRNRLLVCDGSGLIILEHEDWVANNDLVIPAAPGIMGLPYPNPFKSFTTLELKLTEQIPIELEVYNLKGQKVRLLHSGILPKGEHALIWDGKDALDKQVASGIYFIRIKAGTVSQTRRIVLIK
jgi:hypothetical protein